MSGMFFFLAPALLERIFTWPGNFLESHPGLDGPVASFLDAIDPQWANPVAFILFGFGAITYARHPEGSIEAQTAVVVNAILRRTGRRRQGGSGGGGTPATTDGTSGTDAAAPAVDVRTPEPAGGGAS
jgi:hypothetical protein